MEKYVKIYVNMFIMITSLLFILICIYYILPNNYELFTDASDNIFNKVEKIKIKDNNISYDKVNGYYIKFNEDELNIVLDNNIKSDSIIIKRKHYLRVYNDCNIYINNNKKDINIELYKLKS